MSGIVRLLRPWAISALTLVAATTGCSDEIVPKLEPEPQPRIERVEIRSSGATIEVGQSLALRAAVYLDDGTERQGVPIKWSSSDPAIASVDDTGDVLGVAPGQVLIAARVDGVRGEAEITVEEPAAELPTVDRVQIDPESATLYVGESADFQVRAFDAEGQPIEGRASFWESDDPQTATIDASGTATAVAPGQAKVRATIDGVQGEATVTVAARPVASVEIEDIEGPLFVGTTHQLRAIPRDANGNVLEGRPIEWGSSNELVASVDSSGIVSAMAVGMARIVAAVEGVEAEIDVEITIAVAHMEVSPGSLRLVKTETVQLEVRLFDAEGNELDTPSIRWESTDDSVASVDPTGNVRGNGGGTAQIRALAGGKIANAEVEVEELRFSSLDIGGQTPCGIATNGRTYCWGVKLDGAQPSRSSHFPHRLSEQSFVEVSVGVGHVCARTAAGEVWCQGLNTHGQLGNGTTANAAELVPVQGGVTFRQISAGFSYTCGIAVDNKAWCWGLNGRGNLGDGTITNRSLPVEVAGGHLFERLYASRAPVNSMSTCALTQAGEAWCWGDGMAGQLGDGVRHVVHEPVRAAPGLLFAEVATSSYWHAPGEWPAFWGHTCGRTAAGDLHCWGANNTGQLGDGTFVDSLVPLQVSSGTEFRRVGVSGQNWYGFSCGLDADGTIYCWGSNEAGQIGDGTFFNQRPSPVAISSSEVFADMRLGMGFACGLTGEGLVHCWGQNFVGSQGRPASSGEPLPGPAVWQ